MNIRNFSLTVFSSQFILNKTDGVATNKITPITITSNDKIMNTFIFIFFLVYATNCDILFCNSL